MSIAIVTTVLMNNEFHSSHLETDEDGALLILSKDEATILADVIVDELMENVFGDEEYFIEHGVADLGGGIKITGTTNQAFICFQQIILSK